MPLSRCLSLTIRCRLLRRVVTTLFDACFIRDVVAHAHISHARRLLRFTNYYFNYSAIFAIVSFRVDACCHYASPLRLPITGYGCQADTDWPLPRHASQILERSPAICHA